MALSLSFASSCGTVISEVSVKSCHFSPHCSQSKTAAARCQLSFPNRPSCSSGVDLLSTSFFRPIQRGTRQRGATAKQDHCLSRSVRAALPDLAAGAAKTKFAPLTIKNVKIVSQPPENNRLRIRVDIDGQATKRAFDTVLKDLARNAPPVPGFRKAKGGKTSFVPLNVIYQMMGPKLVRKFVIEEIIKATLNSHAEKEGIKVKNELKTDQSSDQLNEEFEPGKEFGFDATLDLQEEEAADESV